MTSPLKHRYLYAPDRRHAHLFWCETSLPTPPAEVAQWCKEQFGDDLKRFALTGKVVKLAQEKDAMLYKIRWF